MLKSSQEEYERARPFKADMRRFCEIVSNDEDLQKKLFDAVDSGINYQGFKHMYVQMASEHGCNFNEGQLDIAFQEQKQGKEREIPNLVQKLLLEIADYPY